MFGQFDHLTVGMVKIRVGGIVWWAFNVGPRWANLLPAVAFV